ncbi:MAG: adenosylcobinamide-GDP ribazoletransferase [Clostridia bacterium]|nr:adenosylcobinamide-GDP ribazoletransferase [Clostridia bacterium]
MKLIRAFFMCLGMFTSLPCPYRPWDEDARDWMLVMLPVVGLVIGALWAGLAWLAVEVLHLSSISAALIAALPWLLTGFIHLDGYMDTCDAMLSWRPLEKRLEILKDSHTGAFAVVGLGLLMLFSYDAAATFAIPGAYAPLVFIPIVSRCGSALAVLTLKPIGHSQYAAMEGKAAQRAAVVGIWAVAVGVCALCFGLGPGLCLLIETAAYALAMTWVYRTLQGVSGDVAGFALTVSECVALIAMAQM